MHVCETVISTETCMSFIEIIMYFLSNSQTCFTAVFHSFTAISHNTDVKRVKKQNKTA